MKKIIEKIKSLGSGTIIRTILQILVYINQVVAIFAQSSFASEPWYLWVSFILTLVITGVSYWYNNDWTNGAQLCGDIFKMLEDGKITQEEIAEFIEKHKQGKK